MGKLQSSYTTWWTDRSRSMTSSGVPGAYARESGPDPIAAPREFLNSTTWLSSPMAVSTSTADPSYIGCRTKRRVGRSRGGREGGAVRFGLGDIHCHCFFPSMQYGLTVGQCDPLRTPCEASSLLWPSTFVRVPTASRTATSVRPRRAATIPGRCTAWACAGRDGQIKPAITS